MFTQALFTGVLVLAGMARAQSVCPTTETKEIQYAGNCPSSFTYSTTTYTIQSENVYTIVSTQATQVHCTYNSAQTCNYQISSAGVVVRTASTPSTFTYRCPTTITPAAGPKPSGVAPTDTTFPAPLYDCPTTVNGYSGVEFGVESGSAAASGSLFGGSNVGIYCEYVIGASDYFECNYDNTGSLTSSNNADCPSTACPAIYSSSSRRRRRSERRAQSTAAPRIRGNQVNAARLREGRLAHVDDEESA